MPVASAPYGAYKKVDVETASQGKLIVMLFNGAIQRAEEAKRQLGKGNTQGVHSNLLRAQDIIAELRNALDVRIQPLAQNLDRVYEYFQHLLIQGNIHKNTAPIDEAIGHLVALRDTWREVFDKVARQEGEQPAPPHHRHGAAFMNIQG
jgi:flagellar protein FliS